MPESVPAAEPANPQSKGRVLVIDDEADIRESLETLLELEGYTVEMAVNATEAVATAALRSRRLAACRGRQA
jgi:DNA-binding NtrC family response regulator